ncbi:MAG: hypothetical protein NZ870_05180, partial [bacterium]|nr:hypothetical protein [bacterium]
AFWLTVIVPKWIEISNEALLLTIFGLTIFWEVTMVPFILIIVPPMLVALKGLENRTIFDLNLKPLVRTKSDKIAVFSITSLFCTLYLLLTFSPLSAIMFSQVQPLYAEITRIFTLMCGISIIVIYLISAQRI